MRYTIRRGGEEGELHWGRYEDGPTACVAHPKVMKSIARELKAARAVSPHEVRLASAMSLAPAGLRTTLGFNDGVIYPPNDMPTRAPLRAAVAASGLMGVSPVKTLHALALLVDFSDNKGTRPPADFTTLLFDAANPGSMTSYYNTLSGGKINVTGEAIGYVRAPQPYGYYTNGQSGTANTYPKNTPGLLVDALTQFCKSDSLNRFDTNGDGYVDGIFLIHAGGGAEAENDPTKRADMIWSHKWTLPTPFVNNGVKVFAYSTEPEDGRVGVFAHEFGHVLGLPDLYDTTYRSGGIGDWCLMAAGSWGGNGDQPCRMSAWCMSKLGWINPTVVKKAKKLTLPTLANDPKACYRLWTKGSGGREYFLIENRQATGQDASLPGHGLAVWHIDENQSENTNPLSYLVGLVQADGNRDIENNANGGDGTDLFPGSGPGKVTKLDKSTKPNTNSNAGATTGVALSQIKETNGIVTVSVRV